MSDYLAAALLNVPAIAAKVGDRVSLLELYQDAQLPAIVYYPLSVLPRDYTDKEGYQAARLQVNVIAETPSEVIEIEAVVKAAMSRAGEQIGQTYLIRSVFDRTGPWLKNQGLQGEETDGVWERPSDFLLTFEGV